MLKNKSVILLLAMAIVCLLTVSVSAIETSPKVFDGTTATLNEDITANGCDAAVWAKNNANVTIEGGAIHGVLCTEIHKPEEKPDKKCGYSMAVWATSNSTVTITGGTFTQDADTVNDPTHDDLIYASEGGKIIIKGGTFESKTPDWTLNCKDKSGSSITVMGGRFYKFNPAKANTEHGSGTGVASAGTVEVIVPEGYTVIKDGDWYEVVKLNPAKVFDGVTATLNENVTANGCDAAVWAKNSANVTINGGNIHGQLCTAVHNAEKPTKLCGYSMAVWATSNSTVTITGGTFTQDADYVTDPTHDDLIYASEGGKIIIKGGTFESKTPDWTLNCKDKSGSTITVMGGRFYKFNPAKANTEHGSGTGVASAGTVEVIVPEEYTVIKDGDWYEVVCAHKNPTKVEAKEPTYTTEGYKEHYKCTLCEKLFEEVDAEGFGKTETNIIKLTIPMLIVVDSNTGNATVDDVVVGEAITESGNSSVVELPPVENATSVTVPVASVDQVVAADKGLVVETKDTIVTLDAKAVEEVAKQAEDATNITIEVTKIEEKTLNKEQKEAIKDKEVAIVLSAKILADGKEISNFNGGKVKVEIPFTPAEGTKGSDYKVYYVDDNGKVTAIPTRYVKGNLVVELEHFSEYVVVKEVANAGAPAPAAPAAPAANPNEKDNTPKTGAISVIGLVVAMSVIGLAVLRRKD